MKRILSLLVAVCFLSLCAGCNGGGGGDSGGAAAGSDTSIVTLDFDIGDVLSKNDIKQESLLARIIDIITMARICHAAPLYNYISTLHLEVTGAGFAPIIRNIPITTPSSSFSVSQSVPNGPNRRFYIELRDDINNVALYSGNLVIDVGAGGAPQDITVDVSIDGGITPEDYIAIGRAQLKAYKLERAYAAFDTALNLETTHPLANFFCALTHLLLLIQKDDPAVNAAAPNADLAAMFNLYANLDIYTDTIVPAAGDPYSIAPDIYDDNYDERMADFFDDDWNEPSPMLTDAGIDAWENVLLPEIDAIIENLRKAQQDPDVATTLTTLMHSQIASVIEADIKVDRADIYILQAIAYAMKAYINHFLAYNLYTNTTYWRDNLDPDSEIYDSTSPMYIGHPYKGLQDVIDRDPGDPGEEVFDLISGSDSDTYLTAAKNAYSRGAAKLKSGLQFIQDSDKRSLADKEAENHIFNIADYNDPVSDGVNKVNIDKVITNIDEVRDSLAGTGTPPLTVTGYDDYDDEDYLTKGVSIKADDIGINLSELFSSPDRSIRPTFYYHSIGDTDVVILDTNDLPSSAAFIDGYNDVATGIKRDGEPSWKSFNDGTNDLEDILSEERLPDYYKFVVPVVPSGIAMNGNIADWSGTSIRPVMLNRKDSDDISPNRDIVEVYMAKDATYLYIGLRFVGTPYTGTFATDDYLNYRIGFNCRDNHRGLYSVPVTVELNGSSGGWQWRLYNHGAYPPLDIPPAIMDSNDHAMGDMLTVRIPLSYIVIAIDANEPSEHFPTGSWDGKETHIGVSLQSNIAAETPPYCWEETGPPKLAELNIPPGP